MADAAMADAAMADAAMADAAVAVIWSGAPTDSLGEAHTILYRKQHTSKRNDEITV
jgi:hypothetical protein